MSPFHLESLLVLRLNLDLWNANLIDEIILENRNQHEIPIDNERDD